MKTRDFKVFHEIQQDFAKSNRNSQNFMKSTEFNTILLKTPGFIEIQRFQQNILFFANSFAATTGTNTRNATF